MNFLGDSGNCSSSKQRRREAGIVFLIQALAFFLFSARTNVRSISRRSKEPPGIVSLSLRFSIFFALQSIIMRRAVPMVLTNSFPCTETAPTRRRSPSSQFLSLVQPYCAVDRWPKLQKHQRRHCCEAQSNLHSPLPRRFLMSSLPTSPFRSCLEQTRRNGYRRPTSPWEPTAWHLSVE